MSYIYPVILSGGVGSRLWPLSRSHFPKQFLKLSGDHSLIQETALRTIGPGFAKPLIICQAKHGVLAAEQMRAIGVLPENIILEPAGRNTAPAAAVAAMIIAKKDPEALLLLMPADHVIRDQAALHEAIRVGADLASRGFLTTFGICPQSPETGYGYVQRGPALCEGGKAFAVSRFIEKPDAQTAQRYVNAGDYYWNSGMFLFQATAFLEELQKWQPDIVTRCHDAVEGGEQRAEYLYLASRSFEQCKSISLDYAVMEHTKKAAILPAEMGWSDIGSWSALWDIADKDASGNVIEGDVLGQDVQGSYLRSDGPMIAVQGLSDLLVVATADAVLVSSKWASQDIKSIVGQLERENLHMPPCKLHHPWGSLARVEQGENFEVNMITVNPGAVLPLEGRHPPGGHWIIVSGSARVTGEDQTTQLSAGGAYALSGNERRVENNGKVPLQIIEALMGMPSA